MGGGGGTPQPQEGEQQDEKTDTDTRQQHLQQRNTSGELRERTGTGRPDRTQRKSVVELIWLKQTEVMAEKLDPHSREETHNICPPR